MEGQQTVKAQEHLEKGVTLAEQGKLEEAIVEFRKAIRIAPADERAHYNLGLALGTKGDLNSAAAEFRESLGQGRQT